MTDSVRSYTPREVAALFNVHVRSVSRWADKGELAFFRTPGRERRYYADPIDARLRNGEQTDDDVHREVRD
jgi:excisionase family DNA binding protein